jgi:hypothetical protein
MQVQTINLKGNEYATVPQRLKQFRQDNPRSIVETKPEFQPDGTIVFSAKIVKDKKDENSAEATGHSYGKNGEVKAFEKLETVAVGRALALLGYLNNGQIATSEEMEEFENFQMEKILDSILAATTREQFTEILAKLTPAQKREVTPMIQRRIKELKDADTNTGGTAES